MDMLRCKTVSPVELTNAFLTRIEHLNPSLNVFITVTAEQAVQQAMAAEADIQKGVWRGPLHGIPLALKDLIDTADTKTTAASAVFEKRVPLADAQVVKRLKDAGAVLLGKLNMHEFAFGGTSVASHFGPVRNPWDRTRIAGGSSGGSAAAVAAGLCMGALGSDTAASIRQPAAYCGVTGLKPTYGRVSSRGVVPLSWSLDHIGPLCRSAMDAAYLLEAIAGYDSFDATSVNWPVEHYAGAMLAHRAPMRLGIVRRPYFDGLDSDMQAAVHAAIETLASMSAAVRDVELPYSNILMTIASAEALAFHKPYFAQTPHLYQAMTRSRLEHAGTISAADYVIARREMERLRATADEVFEAVDVLITPTTAVPPISIESGYIDPPLPDDGVPVEIRNTHMFDVLGLPAISVPCGFTKNGMPIGLQIAGPRFGESQILALAHAYQQLTNWHLHCAPC